VIRSIRWVIFCRVVDHFGDAGFSLRLARALTKPPHQGADLQMSSEVLLVIDRVDLTLAMGADEVEGLTVLDWNQAVQTWARNGVPDEHRAHVLIEAFACDIPQVFRSTLTPSVCWITLDYLATEPWADSVHGLLSPLPRNAATSVPSLKNQPMVRRWVIPGFSKDTGGLVHDSWRHLSIDERDQWRSKLTGLKGKALRECFLVMGFGYSDAPWADLHAALRKKLPAGFSSYRILQPETIRSIEPSAAKALPLSHAEFDAVLQACDLNCVRGEDSFVRAHWASAGPWRIPFVWQPYRQEALGHADKLAGWMHQVLATDELMPWRKFHLQWNGLRPAGSPTQSRPKAAGGFDWPEICLHWTQIQDQLHKSCLGLAGRPALETTLWRLAI